jgi:thiamine-phosphate pyrophosphorylase
MHDLSSEIPTPITYLITSGELSAQDDFARTIDLIRRAVESGVSLIQIREKNLPARRLYELSCRAAEITNRSATRLLINDRADIARAAGADGVHLTSHSLKADVIRQAFGPDLLIGVSTHSLVEAGEARDAGADFVVFGPIFETPSKSIYGSPLGVECLREVVQALRSFPVIALGGITLDNFAQALEAGASGIAAIRLFTAAKDLPAVIESITHHKPARP